MTPFCSRDQDLVIVVVILHLSLSLPRSLYLPLYCTLLNIQPTVSSSTSNIPQPAHLPSRELRQDKSSRNSMGSQIPIFEKIKVPILFLPPQPQIQYHAQQTTTMSRAAGAEPMDVPPVKHKHSRAQILLHHFHHVCQCRRLTCCYTLARPRPPPAKHAETHGSQAV